MNYKHILVAILATSLFADEISVFEAGNLNSKSPYGLTQNEQLLLKNSTKVETLNQNYSDIGLKLNTAIERIEGLQSLVEGNGRQISLIDQRLTRLESQVSSKDENTSKDYANLEKYVKESRAIQNANYKKINKVLAELSSIIDSINKNYVSKSEIQSPKQNSKKTQPENIQKFKNAKLPELLSEANQMYKNKNYIEAKERYEYLISKNHRPAESNFMLGEIEYFTQNYANAINFYKKSIAIYDKANYTPKLLYHTAISFDKIGQKENGDKFYKTLKETYPNSEEAKASPTRW